MALVALRPFADELSHFHNTLAALKNNLHDLEAAFELTVKSSETKLSEAQGAQRKAETEADELRKDRDVAEAKVQRTEDKYARECEKSTKLEEKLERRREAQLKRGSQQKEASAAAQALAKLRREVNGMDSDEGSKSSSSSPPPPRTPRKSVASNKEAKRASSGAASTERRRRRLRSESESEVRGRGHRSRSRRSRSGGRRSRGRGRSSSSGDSRGSRGGSRSRGGRGKGRSSKGRDAKGKGKSGEIPLCIPFILGKCPWGSRCRDRHPTEEDCRQARDSLSQKECRFGKDCRRKDCIFQHPGDRDRDSSRKRSRS